MNVIVDIDGTIADNNHRLHHIQGVPKDWKSYHAGVYGDAVIRPMVELVKALYIHHKRIYLVTGRPEESRDDTIRWLSEVARCPWDELHMRPNGDFRPDYEIKLEILENIGGASNFELAIEDRKQVVNMWRDQGILTLHCADGDY